MRILALGAAVALALCAGCGDKNGKTQADATPYEPESRYEPAPGYVDYAPSGSSSRGAAGAPESAAAIKPAPPPADTSGDEVLAPSGSRTYVVQKGDTLSSIARKFYGDQKRWKDIHQANRQLTNPNKLPVGAKLIIP
jgi:nucleoid-associated protein YgaU